MPVASTLPGGIAQQSLQLWLTLTGQLVRAAILTGLTKPDIQSNDGDENVVIE